MRKSLLSLMLIIILVMSTGVLAFAAEYKTPESINVSVSVVNPFVEWDPEQDQFQFIVNATEGLNDFYIDSGSFTVASTTSYQIGAQLNTGKLGDGEAWEPVKINGKNSAFSKAAQHRNIFDVRVRDAYNNWSDWTRLHDAGKLSAQANPNTLALPRNVRSHEIELALVLVDSSSTSGTPGMKRLNELPAGEYRGKLTIVISEVLQ